MLLSTSSLEIRRDPEFGQNALVFKFIGKFTEEASIEGTRVWKKEFDENPDIEDWVLIWDCLEMTGFEISARKEWYKYLKDSNPRIEFVVIAAKNVLIRGAARVMMDFFGLKSQIVKSLDEIRESA